MQPRPISAMAVYGTLTASLFSASAAVPTPLYRTYQENLGLLPFHITLIFAAYVVTLMAALLIGGRLSDHVGRRPMIAVALVLNILGLAVFMMADSFGALVLGRLVQGLAVGVALPTCGAAIIDANRTMGPTLNAVTPFLGLTLGAVVTGGLVAWAPLPLVLPYLAAAGLSVVALALLATMPETGYRRAGAIRSLIPQLTVPVRARGMLGRVMPVTAAGWALGGLYMSLMPGLIADATGIASPLLGAAVVGTLMSMAATAVMIGRTRPAVRTLMAGSGLLVAGIVLTMLGIETGSAPLLFAGTAVAGLGQGGIFSSTMRILLPMADDADRAGLLAAFFVLSYVAFAVPTVAAGLAVPLFGLGATILAYGAGVVVLVLISVVAMRMPVLTPAEPPV